MPRTYWLYKNKLENVSKIIGHDGTANTNYGTKNIYDNDITTSFKWNSIKTPPAGNSIFFDFGTAVYLNSAVALTNIDNIDGTSEIYIKGGSGTTVANFTGTFNSPPFSTTGTLGTVSWFTSGNPGYRYWRLDIRSSDVRGTQHTLTELFLGKKLELTESPVYPLIERTNNDVEQSLTDSGKRYKYFNYARKSWTFNFEVITNANYVSLKNMNDFLKGSYKPFFFCLDPSGLSTEIDINLVRMAEDSYTYEEVVTDVWNTNFGIEEVV